MERELDQLGMDLKVLRMLEVLRFLTSYRTIILKELIVCSCFVSGKLYRLTNLSRLVGEVCIRKKAWIATKSLSKIPRAIIQLLVESNDLNAGCGGRVSIKLYSGSVLSELYLGL